MQTGAFVQPLFLMCPSHGFTRLIEALFERALNAPSVSSGRIIECRKVGRRMAENNRSARSVENNGSIPVFASVLIYYTPCLGDFSVYENEGRLVLIKAARYFVMM